MLTLGFLVYWIGKCLLVEPRFSLERQFMVHCLTVTIRHSSHNQSMEVSGLTDINA